MPVAAKADFKPKLVQALYGGGRVTFQSADLEAVPLRHSEHQKRADSVLLVAGMQPIVIKDWKMWYGPSFQSMVALPKFDSIDLAYLVHKRSTGYDGLIIFYSDYDHGLLQSYEPLIRERYDSFPLLPRVCIDIQKPFGGQGISASQAHLSSHYGIGVEKPSVNMEVWDRVLTGPFFGMSQAAVRKELVRIRDERNARCLIDNIADLEFIARNIRWQNKFKISITYPNEAKIAELEGE